MKQGDLLLNILLFVRVKPHPRPRIIGKRVYQVKQDELTELLKAWAHVKIKGEVFVDCYFYFSDKLKRDTDNLLKTVYDRMVDAGILEDDRLIVGGTFKKILGHHADMLMVKVWKAEGEHGKD